MSEILKRILLAGTTVYLVKKYLEKDLPEKFTIPAGRIDLNRIPSNILDRGIIQSRF